MTSKSTPGPWSLSDETTRDGLRSRLVHGMPEGMLAIVRVEHQGRYYGEANAHLIAAAPELLEALLQLVACHEAFNASSGNMEEAYYKLAKYAYPHWKAARAAISKAEGRS